MIPTHRRREGEEQQEPCRCKQWWSHVTLCRQRWFCPLGVEWRHTLPSGLFIWPRTLALCLRTGSNTNIPLTQPGQSHDSKDHQRSFPKCEVCDWRLTRHLYLSALKGLTMNSVFQSEMIIKDFNAMTNQLCNNLFGGGGRGVVVLFDLAY